MEELSFQAQKKAALIRRSDKLIGWLHRDDYAIYVDETSVDYLLKLIKLIIWALEYSIPSEEWREFLLLFQESRKILAIEEGEDQEQAYKETVESLISSLETYRSHIEDREW